MTGKDQGEKYPFGNAILILHNILERAFDLANFSAPGGNFLLNDFD
jgi:hypothetical protein